MNNTTLTQAQWCQTALECLNNHFAEHGLVVPDNVHVRIGHTSRGIFHRKNSKGLVRAEAWKEINGIVNITINAMMVKEPHELLGLMAHELIHAVLQNKGGHSGAFIDHCNAIDLLPKNHNRKTGELEYTSTSPGQVFLVWASEFIIQYGACPGEVFAPGYRKQGTRLVKASCLSCGMIIRASLGALKSRGVPSCFCNGKQFYCDALESEDEED